MCRSQRLAGEGRGVPNFGIVSQRILLGPRTSKAYVSGLGNFCFGFSKLYPFKSIFFIKFEKELFYTF